jgi:trk system potassium uptake protein TrkH
VQWALVIGSLSFLGASFLALALAFIESEYPFLDLLFEAISAFGTVGFTTGITGDLSSISQVLLAVAMFVGRVVPPMAIVIALSGQDESDSYRYAKEGVLMS